MALFSDSSKVKAPLARDQASCGKCGLYRRCKSPKMEPVGEGRKGIFILAEAPGQREDSTGKQMIGQAGSILKSHLDDLGIDLELDCRKMNAISCFPGDSGVSEDMIDCCRPRVLKAIAEMKPKVVILLGGTAIKSLMNSFTADEDEGDGGISLWRGWRIPDQRLGCWICPTYHPSFIDQRRDGLDAAEAIFHLDLAGAVEASTMKFPKLEDIEQYLEYDLSEEDIIARIKEAIKAKFSAFDYETTGLKPQRARHDIVTCSICDRWNRSFSFFRTAKINPYLIEYLESDSEKYGANIAYEDTWTEIVLDRKVNNWMHDTVIAAHVFDNRRGISGLKFQSYVNFGLPDYSKGMDKYLQGDPKDANSFNHIYSAPKRVLLKYNAIDSLMTFWLAMKQRLEMGR